MHFVTVVVTLSLAIYWVAGYAYDENLFEGQDCPLEDGTIGICKKLPECPYRVEEVRQGRRSSDSKGRCSFDNFIEIVCCPLNISDKIGLRPAEVACREFEDKVRTSDVGFHIFGGTEAEQGEFPYAVALGYHNDEINDEGVVEPIRYFCGGTLISSQYVLTAAHCVNNVYERVPFEVRIGNKDLSVEENTERIEISRIISHPKYKRSQYYHDVAILQLNTTVRITSGVRPACLQTRTLEAVDPTANVSFVVIGWGATIFGSEGTKILRKAPNMRIVGTSKCSERYQNFHKLPNGLDNTMLCAVDTNLTRGADTCLGDSGGPLLMISEDGQNIIGVTSFGHGGCGGTTPGVYISVYSYLDWIEEHVWPDEPVMTEQKEEDNSFSFKLTINTA